MALILLVVFALVFTVAALLVSAVGSGAASRDRFQAALAAALNRPELAAAVETVDVRKKNSLSSIAWLHSLLVRMDAAVRLQLMLDQAELAWTPSRLLLSAAAAWVISAYALHLKMDLGAAALLWSLPLGAAPLVYVGMKRSARFERFHKVLPDSIDLMVGALRAGHSMIGALGIVSFETQEPVRREFKLCFEEQNYGVDIRIAMSNLLRRVPLQDLRIITTAILIQKESGGNLAEVLERIAELIRDRFRLRDQIRVHTAQSRLSGLILTLAPGVLGVTLAVVDPGYMSLLLNRPLGHKMMAVGGVMNLIGLLIIRKIVRIRV